MRPNVHKRFDKNFPQVLHDFDAYRLKFETTFPKLPSVQKLNSPGLYRNFDKIICRERLGLDHNYVNSDWKTIGFFGFLKRIPTSWSDKLRIGLMRLPK